MRDLGTKKVIKDRKQGSGGFRPGAGRPKLTRTQAQVDAVAKVLRKYGRRTRRDMYSVAASMAWGLDEFEGIADATRLKAIQFLDGCTKVAEGRDADHTFPGPAVYLPEKRPDPAKVLPLHNDGQADGRVLD